MECTQAPQTAPTMNISVHGCWIIKNFKNKKNDTNAGMATKNKPTVNNVSLKYFIAFSESAARLTVWVMTQTVHVTSSNEDVSVTFKINPH